MVQQQPARTALLLLTRLMWHTVDGGEAQTLQGKEKRNRKEKPTPLGMTQEKRMVNPSFPLAFKQIRGRGEGGGGFT